MPLPVITPLADSFDRCISYLRVSLTDRCNFRCRYCMPEQIQFLPRAEVLSFEEIVRIVSVFASLGVRRVRLTGGEPTVRRDVQVLVGSLCAIEGIESVVMTTNAHRLAELAEPLARAGLSEVNVSLDTLDPLRFQSLTRTGELEPVLRGVDAALRAGLKVKLNAVALRGSSDGDVAKICEYAWNIGARPRFIEWMPMSDGELFGNAPKLSAEEIRAAVEQHFGEPLVAMAAGAGGAAYGPARYWHLASNPERVVGIISAMTEHFCDSCNRVRLTAVGDLHTCLAYDDALSLREIVRTQGSDENLRNAIRSAVGLKRSAHDFHDSGAGAPKKHMISIGG